MKSIIVKCEHFQWEEAAQKVSLTLPQIRITVSNPEALGSLLSKYVVYTVRCL